MYDRVPTYPGRVKITPANGDPEYYATITMADEPSVEGTPMAKATFLKDATAALFGLGAAAVPDGVLAFLGRFNQHTWKRVNGSNVVSYVTSSNRNAYPDSGTSGGYTYRYVGIPFDNLQAPPVVVAAMGSYVGDDTYGATHPTVIDMGIEADLIFIGSDHTTNAAGFGVKPGRIMNSSTGISTTWSGTEVSFYAPGSSHAQFNANNRTYYWIALKFNV